MTAPPFDPDRSAAMRAELVDHVHDHPARSPRPTWQVVGILAAGILIGVGGSSAAFAVSGLPAPASSTDQSTSAIDPPAGVVPGAPVVTLIADPRTVTVSAAAQTIPLGNPPEGATHIRVTVLPRSAGTLTWGTDAGFDDFVLRASAGDLVTDGGTTWTDLVLAPSVDSLYASATDGFTGDLTLQYLGEIPTHLAVNDRGQTYGIAGGPDGSPDLVAVMTAEGQAGYALSTDLAEFSPDHPGQPGSPDEAARWQAERQEKYPHGWDVPVYERDGVTRVGEFHVDG